MATSGLLPTPQARDWKGGTGKNRHSLSVADVLIFSRPLHPVRPLPKQAIEEAKQMIAGSGRKLLRLYEQSSQHGASLRTSTASLLLNPVWYSRNCALNWKGSVTRYNRLLFRLLPSTRRTDGTEFGLLRTPLVRQTGIPVERLMTKDGQPYRLGQTAYDRQTGRQARVGLTQQLGRMTGEKLQLQPAFVSWMMGLPEGYCDFPMEPPSVKLDGARKRSKL